MRYAIVLPDGAADEPVDELSGQTPLQVARIPNMDWVAAHGRLGRVVTVPSGFVPGTDVATLCLFGYDPRRYFTGRAPLEAAAMGLTLGHDEIVFRCNLITVEQGRMRDFTAGHIAQPDANALVAALNEKLAQDGCTFHSGVSYRNLMVAGGGRDWVLRCMPPHDIPEQLVAEHLPVGVGAERVTNIMDRAAAILADHPINRRRLSEGKSPATHVWLWGQGRPAPIETLQQRFGLRGAVITAVDVLRGLGVQAGMDLIPVPGATGYFDTDYDAKGAAAVRALDELDLVVVHVEAADEAGHQGKVDEKIKALERIDEAVVGPLLDALRRHGDWRMLIAPDHPTPVGTKSHSGVPPPFCYAGTGVSAEQTRPFTERDAAATGVLVDPGHALIGEFLGR